MKLRLFGDSVRVRVRKPDIQALVSDGFIEKSLRTGAGTADVFAYRLELVETPGWELRSLPRGISISIPQAVANQWAATETVGISFTAPWGVRVLIEKDFPCLEPRPGETEDGTFARPEGEPIRCTANV